MNKADTLREAADILQERGYYSDGTPRQLRDEADKLGEEETAEYQRVLAALREHKPQWDSPRARTFRCQCGWVSSPGLGIAEARDCHFRHLATVIAGVDE